MCGAADAAPPEDDRLSEELDPYGCGPCLASGDVCEFHAGFAAGWDACVVLMAEAVIGRE
jgi:hypothetical protein